MPTAVLPGLTCAIAGLVEDRQRDRRRAGVELADVADRGVVAAPALRALADVAFGSQPAACAVESSSDVVLDRELPGLAAGLLERELGAVDRRLRLRARRALQRQARVDRQRLGRRASPPAAPSAAAARRRRTPPTRERQRARDGDRVACACAPSPSSSDVREPLGRGGAVRREALDVRDRDDRLRDLRRRRVAVDPLVGQRLQEPRDRQPARVARRVRRSAARGWCPSRPCRSTRPSPARRGRSSRSCAAGRGTSRRRRSAPRGARARARRTTAAAVSRSGATTIAPWSRHAAPATSAVASSSSWRSTSARTARPSVLGGRDQHRGRGRAVLGLAEQVGGDELRVGGARRRSPRSPTGPASRSMPTRP